MDWESMNLASVGAFSQYAASAAREYVALTEGQLLKAKADLHDSAEREYRKIELPDETDYETHVTIIDKKFEEDYLPILRFSQVIYVYMVFESYIQQHVDEIEAELGRKGGALKKLKKNKKCGFVKAVRLYFQEIKWSLLEDDEWEMFEAISEVRNCIVHNSGIVRGCEERMVKKIYALAVHGIEVHRYKGKDIGVPMVVHPKFLTCFLDILEKLFNTTVEKCHEEFWNGQVVRPVRTG